MLLLCLLVYCAAGAALPKVLISLAMHIEDASTTWPNRTDLVNFVNQVNECGMKFSLGADYGWLNNVALHDKGQPNTNGLPILTWLVEQGVELDSHCHDSPFKNSADNANLIAQAGGVCSSISSGRIYSPPEDQDWEPLRDPVVPKSGGPSWQATAFWGAATFGHGGEDDTHTTVWRPTSSYMWTYDEPTSDLMFIGNGNVTLAAAQELVQMIGDKQLTAGLFTTSIMIDPVHFIGVKDGVTVDQLCQFSASIRSLPYAVWVVLEEVKTYWAEYGYCTVEDIQSSYPCSGIPK